MPLYLFIVRILMIRIRKTVKEEFRRRKNLPSRYEPSMTVIMAAFLLTAMIVLGPMSIQQQQQQALAQQQPSAPGSVLKLSRTNIPIDIPLLKGYENDNEIYVIATDVSDEKTAADATNLTGFEVNWSHCILD